MKEIRLDGIIGNWENTAEQFKERLNELNLDTNDELKVIINSPGGSVFDGFAIYNTLIALPNKITTKVEGLAASIATLIMLSGESVEMSDVSMLMIHNSSSFVEGNKEELEKQAETLAMIDSTLHKVYMNKTGESKNKINRWMEETTWFDSSEAKKIGFVDEIVDKVDAHMAAQFKNVNKSKIMKLTDLFKNFLSDAPVDGGEAPNASAEGAAAPENVEGAEGATAEGAETPEAVTPEMFDNLVKAVSALAEEIEKNAKAQADAQAQAMEKKFNELVAKMPATRGVPQTTAQIRTENEAWVDPHAKFKARMQEIEQKTRN